MGLATRCLKLLFDENVSARLVGLLANEFPDSGHVDTAGLRGRSDEDVWSHAAEAGYLVVSKDSDFADMSFVRGHPPKVILIRVGNAGTNKIAELLRLWVPAIERFNSDPDASLLELVDR